MYRIDREKRSKIARDIVSTTRIRTQQDFQNEYNARYPDNYIALSTARRMMVDAGIDINFENGLYEYHPEKIPTSASVLNDILYLKSYGCYTMDKFCEPILLSVDIGHEKAIANLFFDLWKEKVFVILGYGCILIYCTDENIYNHIANMLSSEEE